MKKIVFTGGGSAGHVLPNLALIEELLSDGKTEIYYIGSNGIEKGIAKEWKLPYTEITPPKLVRGGGFAGLKRNLRIPLEFRNAKKQAEKGLRLIQPDLVFSKGGYVALPVIAAAKKLKIPCLAHESDYSAGLANRLSARACKTVFTSFPETAKTLPHGKFSGAPLRRSIFNTAKAEAKKAMGIPFQSTVLLIFGGGSGSKSINDAVRNHLKELTEKYFILHVCGKGNLVENTYKNYRQFEFISDMGRAYACSDLILSRSGAGAVFEITALKKPGLFVPLEGQTRGDQWENAEYFRQKGLCHILPQSRLSELVSALDKVNTDEGLKERLAHANYPSGNGIILRDIYKILGI
ncbi:MAG: UDP-N-acetylglucosamine--N-acetylmuramyl-(pentapeptide) pyrophosphoryl-undecaprenol N-acetylglucosamine transferase [Clostridia bacterium]|nr:UDP-N-acetylglucosamine--N-acetylmuramyl-(pentapeptide) pyrophosphoryl-undecaprenol N-acetylglucosamine transferase [Clostridia bacterium]